MPFETPIPFCGNPLDRASAQRQDDAWLAAQRAHDRAVLFVFYKGQPLHERRQGGSSLLPLTMAALSALPDGEPVLLSLDGRAPVFALAASAAPPPPLDDLGAYAPLRQLAPYLSPQELAIAGQAVWLLDWHRRHRFCAKEGGETLAVQGGARRVNPNTGAEHYPRVDPVAIVLPVHGDEACIGRGPHFPEGLMSAFAGYLEPGESLEECAVRELFEEAGLRVTGLRYLFSQPWPFPSSLMAGFIAEVEDKTLGIDGEEIVEARWVKKEEVRALLAGGGPEGLFVPPPMAIAHQIMKAWTEE
jgi:NAD+ diphosphatase